MRISRPCRCPGRAWLSVVALGVALCRGLAVDVSLAWEPVGTPDVAGYRLYYGSPAGQFDQVIDTGLATTWRLVVSDPTRTYSFRVTCYNTLGQESDPSEAIAFPDPGSQFSISMKPVAGVTEEDVPAAVVLEGLDAWGRSLAYEILSSPVHGVLVGVPPDLLYVPDPDFAGEDTFTFRASNGVVETAPTAGSLLVIPVDDPPRAEPGMVIVDEDSVVAVDLVAWDADGDGLSYVIVEAPQHGQVLGVAPHLVYLPAADFHGTDTFTFAATDGRSLTVPTPVVVIVNPVEDAPVAIGGAERVEEDSAVGFRLLALDVDGDPLTYRVLGGPLHGTLVGVAPDLVYLPAPDYAGSDTVSFVVSDGILESLPASVRIEVVPVNDLPQAARQSLATVEDQGVSVTLSAVDVDGDPLTYRVTRLPLHGELLGTPPAVSYRPATNYFGSDSFWFRASDGRGESQDAEVSVQVTPVNDAPVAASAVFAGLPGKPLSLVLRGEDVETGTLSYRVVSGPSRGVLSSTPPNLVYTPANGFKGDDTLRFVVNDGLVDSVPATVTLRITQDGVPVVVDGLGLLTPAVGVGGGYRPLEILLQASDPDTRVLSWQIVRPPMFGSLAGTPPTLIYEAGGGFPGVDRFTFRVSDGSTVSREGEFWVRDGLIAVPRLPMRIEGLRRPGFPVQLRVEVPAVPGLEVELERSEDLVGWSTVAGCGAGEGISFEEPGGAQGVAAGYRARFNYVGP